jgi:hypothetical protein
MGQTTSGFDPSRKSLRVRGLLDARGSVDRKDKRFMPISSLAVGAGAFGDAVTEIHEILA